MKFLLSLPIIIIDLLFSLSVALFVGAIIYFLKTVVPVIKDMFTIMNDNSVGTAEGKLVNMQWTGSEGSEDSGDLEREGRSHYAEAGFL